MHISRATVRGQYHNLAILFLFSFALSLPVNAVFAQQPRITYLYDDLGRLVRLVTETGEAATYHCDAVGNILRITRESGIVANANVVNISPDSGIRGTSFPIAISGFNLAGAKLTSNIPGITFSNVRTKLDQIIGEISVSTTVPIGSTQIIVETQFGALPISLMVLDTPPSVAILSPTESTRTMEGAQLTLSAQAVDNVRVSQVVWSLNG